MLNPLWTLNGYFIFSYGLINLGKKKNWSNALISKYGSAEDIKDEVVDYLYYYNGIEELDGVIEIIWEDFTKENVNFKF